MNWKNVQIVPTFVDQGVSCYQLEGGDFKNEYYIVSEAETRKLLNNPEIVGYETYYCLIPSTSQMLYYFKEQKKVTTANILSILRGALNYPLEESCYREHIRVHDISFLSSERVFHEDEIAGLEIKYSKLTMVPGSTLLIGDIIATGETLIHCLRYVTDFYRAHGAKLRNIIIFTIGGTKGIEILERLTEEIREYWRSPYILKKAAADPVPGNTLPAVRPASQPPSELMNVSPILPTAAGFLLCMQYPPVHSQQAADPMLMSH